MKEREFIWWLRGYLEGETYLSNEKLEKIKKNMDEALAQGGFENSKPEKKVLTD